MIKRNLSLPISKNIIRSFVLNFSVFTICILILASMLYTSMGQKYKQLVLERNNASVHQLGATIEVYLGEIIPQIIPTLLNKKIHSYILNNDGSLRYDVFSDIYFVKGQNNQIHSIYVYLESDGSLLTTEGFWEKQGFFDPGWLRYLDYPTNYFHWIGTRRYTNYSNKQQNRIFSVFRSYERNGERLGALVINFNLDKLEQILEQSVINENDFIVLVDEYGEMVTHTTGFSNAGDEVRSVFSPPFNEEISVDDYIVDRITLNNGWVLYRFDKYSSLSMQLRVVGSMLLRTVAVIFFVGVIVYALASSLATKPLRKLVANLKEKSEPPKSAGSPLDEYCYIGIYINKLLDTNKRLSEAYGKYLPVLQDRWLKGLLAGEYLWDEAILQEIRSLEINLLTGFYRVLLIDMHRDVQPAENERNVLLMDLKNRLHDAFPEYMVAISDRGYMQLTALLSTASLTGDDDLDDVQKCERLIEAVKKACGITVSVGLGRFYNTISKAVESRLEAEKALGYIAISGAGKAMVFNEPHNTVVFRYPERLERNLIVAYKTGNLPEAMVRTGRSKQPPEAFISPYSISTGSSRNRPPGPLRTI